MSDGDAAARFAALVQSPLRASLLRFLHGHPRESFDVEQLMQAFGRMRLDVENCLVELESFGVAARAGLSPRRDERFQAVNCAAVPEALFEPEIFGHERGAFTGALERRAGKLELADKGTLFLDELSELSLTVQGKLLRALEQQRFERVGGTGAGHRGRRSGVPGRRRGRGAGRREAAGADPCGGRAPAYPRGARGPGVEQTAGRGAARREPRNPLQEDRGIRAPSDLNRRSVIECFILEHPRGLARVCRTAFEPSNTS